MTPDLRALAEKWRQEAGNDVGHPAYIMRRCADELEAALASRGDELARFIECDECGNKVPKDKGW